MNDKKQTQSREYLTVLLRRRSVTALCCGILTLALSFYGIIAGVIRTVERFHENGFSSFIYFTMISNTLAALSVAFVLPYAVEGIRKRRFTLPKWVAVFHFVATTSIAIVMTFVLAIISWASPDDAFGGSNIVTHVFCPLLILAFFFQMENGHLLTWKDRLLGVAPFCVYMAVYFIEVVLIGEGRGGWPDIYHIRENMSPALAIPLSLILALSVSTAVAILSNVLTKRRNKKMYRLWRDDMDPIEVRIESFGMGMAAAHSGDKNNLLIPYDILSYLAKRYGIKTEDLIDPFVTGYMIERDNIK